jgi:hypothetical protein
MGTTRDKQPPADEPERKPRRIDEVGEAALAATPDEPVEDYGGTGVFRDDAD